MLAHLKVLQLKARRKQLWQAKIEPRLKAANEACRDSIDKSIAVLTDFIEERKAGARPLAKATLSFRSKWKLVVTSHLPSWLGGDENAHRAFLEQKFNEYIFTSEQLKQAVEAAVKTYLNHVQAIENQLLVDIRVDLADLPSGAIPPASSDRAFEEEFTKLVQDVPPQISGALRMDAGGIAASELVQLIGRRLLAAVARRFGLSAGILTVTASASWATSGVSLLAGIVVDAAVGRIINWATDPVGKLEVRIKEMLDETSKLLIDGQGDNPGLRAELEQLNRIREGARTKALRKIVLGE